MMALRSVVLRERSEHFGDSFLARLRGGRVFSVYLYDSSVRTHLCELTPSFELHLISTWVEPAPGDEFSDDENEWFFDALLPDADSAIIYMHCSEIRALPSRDVACDPEDTFEEVLEGCVANCGGFECSPEVAS
jgi:hypothetical protein